MDVTQRFGWVRKSPCVVPIKNWNRNVVFLEQQRSAFPYIHLRISHTELKRQTFAAVEC